MTQKFPKGDRMNATYRHEFYQEARSLPFVGYSKMLGHDEAQDKEYLLEQYISRLLRNGYLQKSYCMSFFTNYQHGNNDDLLLVSITSTGYELSNGAELHPHLNDTLKRYFQNLNNPEKQNEVLANRKRMGFQAEHWYDFKKVFNSKQALVDHCSEIIKNFGEGQRPRSKGYYFKVLELQDLR